MADLLEDQLRSASQAAALADDFFGPVGETATSTTPTTTNQSPPASVGPFDVDALLDDGDLSLAAEPGGFDVEALMSGGEVIVGPEPPPPPPEPEFGQARTAVRNLAAGAVNIVRLGFSGEERTELFQSFARSPLGPLGDGLLELMGREPDPDKVDRAVKADLEELIPRLDKVVKDLQTPGNFLTQDIMFGLGSLAGAPLTLQALNQEAFEEAKARGETDESARRKGTANMILGGVMEMAGLHAIFKTAGVFRRIARIESPFLRKGMAVAAALSATAGAEGGTEAGQQILLEGMALYDGTDDSIKEIAKRVVKAGLVGAAVGGIAGGVFGGIGVIEQEISSASQEMAETMDLLRIEMEKATMLKQLGLARRGELEAQPQSDTADPDIDTIIDMLFEPEPLPLPEATDAERTGVQTEADPVSDQAALAAKLGPIPLREGEPLRVEGDGDRFFDADSLARATENSGAFRSRDVLVHMHPLDFLDLAQPLPSGEAIIDKYETVRHSITQDLKLTDVPFLSGSTKDGTFTVSGHEGRHRALALNAEGVTSIPVVIRDANIRWSEQTDPTSLDYVANFPESMQPQGKQGGKRAFPFTRDDMDLVQGRRALDEAPITRDAEEAPLTQAEEDALAEDVGFSPDDFEGVPVQDVAPRSEPGLPKSALTPVQRRSLSQLLIDERLPLPEATITGEVGSTANEIQVGEDRYRVTQARKGRRINYKLFQLEETTEIDPALTQDVPKSAPIPTHLQGVSQETIINQLMNETTRRVANDMIQGRDAGLADTAADTEDTTLLEWFEGRVRAIHGRGEFANFSRARQVEAVTPLNFGGKQTIFVHGRKIQRRHVNLDMLRAAFPAETNIRHEMFPEREITKTKLGPLLGQSFNLKETVRMAQLHSAIGVAPKSIDPRTAKGLSEKGLITAVDGKLRLSEKGRATVGRFGEDARTLPPDIKSGADLEMEERGHLQRGERVVLDGQVEAVVLRTEVDRSLGARRIEHVVVRQPTTDGPIDTLVPIGRVRRAFEDDYQAGGVFEESGGFTPVEIEQIQRSLAGAMEITGFIPDPPPPPPPGYSPPALPTPQGPQRPQGLALRSRMEMIASDGNALGGTPVAEGGSHPPTTPPPPGGRGPLRLDPEWEPSKGGRPVLKHNVPYTTFDLSEPRIWQGLTAELQNRMVSLMKVQQDISEQRPQFRAQTENLPGSEEPIEPGKRRREGVIPKRQVRFALNEAMDVYRAETLFPGRSSERLRAFEENLVTPALQDMSRDGVTLSSMGEFMFGRHAPERNRKLRFVAGERALIEKKAEIDAKILMLTAEGQQILREADEIQNTEQGPFDKRAQAAAKAAVLRLRKKAENILARRKKLEKEAEKAQFKIDNEFPDGMSGMTDAEANTIMVRHRIAGTYDVHEKWRLWWKENVTDQRLAMIEEDKLETPEFVQALREAFDDDTYVPLYVIDDPLTTRGKHSGATPSSRGYTIPGHEARRLRGGNVHDRFNPLAALIMDFEKTIVRAEKTKVLRAFLELVRENPNENIWLVSRAKPRADGLMEATNVIDPDSRPAQDFLNTGVRGDFRTVAAKAGRKMEKGPAGFREGDQVIMPDGQVIDMTTIWFDQITGEPFGWHPAMDLSGDNVVVVPDVDGVKVGIEILDPSMLKAMKNLGGQGRMLNVVLMFTHWFRAVTTTYSPTFMMSNPVRDLSQALTFVAGEDSPAAAREVAGNFGKAVRGVYADARSRHGKLAISHDGLLPQSESVSREIATVAGGPVSLRPATPPVPGREQAVATSGLHTDTEKDIPLPDDWPGWAKDLRINGGKSGYFTQDIDVEQRIRAYQKQIKRYNRTGLLKDLREVMTTINQFMLDANESAEMGARLAYYKYLVEHGTSRKTAAFEAKELTINFDRKGFQSWWTNQMYVFSNPSLQGGARTLSSMLTTPGSKTYRYVSMLVAGAVIVAWYNKLIGGDDYDRLVQTQPWLFDRTLVLFIPGTNAYIAPPIPYGFNFFKTLGDVTFWLADGQIGLPEALKLSVDSLDAAFTPVQGPGFASQGLVQRVSPTFFDPVVQLSQNADWLGRPISPPTNQSGPGRANAESYFRARTFPEAITRATTKWLNKKAGGGGRATSKLDYNPEHIDFIAQFVGGGAYRFVESLTTVGWKGARQYLGDEDLEWGPKDIPAFGRFIGVVGDNWPYRVIYGPLLYESGRSELTLQERHEYYEAIEQAALIDNADQRISHETAMRKINSFLNAQAKVEVAIATGGREFETEREQAKLERMIEAAKARLQRDRKYRRAVRAVDRNTK